MGGTWILDSADPFESIFCIMHGVGTCALCEPCDAKPTFNVAAPTLRISQQVLGRHQLGKKKKKTNQGRPDLLGLRKLESHWIPAFFPNTGAGFLGDESSFPYL
jgi:hypothetical protein